MCSQVFSPVKCQYPCPWENPRASKHQGLSANKLAALFPVIVPLKIKTAKNRSFIPVLFPPAMQQSSSKTIIAQQIFDKAGLSELLNQHAPQDLSFEQCIFDGLNLSNTHLRGAQFVECSLADTRLESCQLAETRWLHCKAGGARFRLADLTDALFCQSDLHSTDWELSRLSSARFMEVKLTGALFGGAQTLGLSFHDSLLIGADLRGISFRKQTLEGLNFSDADLAGCDFRDAVFNKGSLRDAHLKNARFDGADLRSVDLQGLGLAALAQHFKGSLISQEQAAELVGSLGVRVM